MSGDEKYDDSNSGTLNKNEERTEPFHAEYKGKALIDGKRWWIDAKIRTNSKNGKKFFSLKFKEVLPKTEAAKPTQAAAQEMDDEIPF